MAIMKGKILFVDDEPIVLDSIRRMLHDKRSDWDMTFVNTSDDALTLARERQFDLVVLDQKLPGRTGLELLAEWKGGESRCDFEVIMLTGVEDNELKRRALDLGATDLLSKPVTKENLIARLESVLRMKSFRDTLLQRAEEFKQTNELLKMEIELRKRMEGSLKKAHRKLKEKNKLLREVSIHDQLTRIYNRRFFDQKLEEYSRLSERFGQPLSCIMADIDHFKVVNDSYGHQAGDYVLRNIAGILEDGIRRTDIIARYGGEEFVVLLHNTYLKDAVNLAEKLRMAVESAKMSYKGLGLRVTISMGVSDSRSGADLRDNLIRKVDGALYQAKKRGRNRVCSE